MFALLMDGPISSAAFWRPGTAMFVRLKLSEKGSREAMATPFTPGIASMRRVTSLQYCWLRSGV